MFISDKNNKLKKIENIILQVSKTQIFSEWMFYLGFQKNNLAPKNYMLFTICVAVLGSCTDLYMWLVWVNSFSLTSQ